MVRSLELVDVPASCLLVVMKGVEIGSTDRVVENSVTDLLELED